MLTLSLINLVLVLVRNDCFVHYYVVEDSGEYRAIVSYGSRYCECGRAQFVMSKNGKHSN